MSEHRDRWLCYGRKVDDLCRTPMQVREPDADELPDWFANGEWGHYPGNVAWGLGFDAGYRAALDDIKTAPDVSPR
jgi:hypothetical protein